MHLSKKEKKKLKVTKKKRWKLERYAPICFFCRSETAKILVMWNFYISEAYNVIIFLHSYFWTERISWFRCLEDNILSILILDPILVFVFLVRMIVRFKNRQQILKPLRKWVFGSLISRKLPSMLVLLLMVLFSSSHTIWIIYLCNCVPVL